MPRSKDGYKVYRPGDPIHFVVTQDFVEVANDFFTYCKERGYNPSEIIRQAIGEWYGREVSAQKAEAPKDELSLDDKLMHLIAKKGPTQERTSLRSAKDLLDEQ